jgi:hypothetical protein
MIAAQTLSSSSTMASTVFRRPSQKQSRRLLSSLSVLAFAFILLICLCPPAVVAKEDTKEAAGAKTEYGTVIGIGAYLCCHAACFILTASFYRSRNNVCAFILSKFSARLLTDVSYSPVTLVSGKRASLPISLPKVLLPLALQCTARRTC